MAHIHSLRTVVRDRIRIRGRKLFPVAPIRWHWRWRQFRLFLVRILSVFFLCCDWFVWSRKSWWIDSMAYRRRQQQGFSRPSFSTFEDENTRNPNSFPPSNDFVESSASSSSSSSLAAKAIRASSARRDSSLSSLYGLSSTSSPTAPSEPIPTPPPSSKVHSSL